MERGRSVRKLGNCRFISAIGPGRGCDRRWGRRQMPRSRQAKLEATPLALLALHANGAAQSSRDALDHSQA